MFIYLNSFKYLLGLSIIFSPHFKYAFSTLAAITNPNRKRNRYALCPILNISSLPKRKCGNYIISIKDDSARISVLRQHHHSVPTHLCLLPSSLLDYFCWKGLLAAFPQESINPLNIDNTRVGGLQCLEVTTVSFYLQ